MTSNHVAWLALEKQHLRGVVALPFIHRDPVDRLLVAQARHEDMPVQTLW